MPQVDKARRVPARSSLDAAGMLSVHLKGDRWVHRCYPPRFAGEEHRISQGEGKRETLKIHTATKGTVLYVIEA